MCDGWLWIELAVSSPWVGAVVVVCSDGFVWVVDEFFLFWFVVGSGWFCGGFYWVCGLVVAIMVVMVGSVADYGSCFGCWWWWLSWVDWVWVVGSGGVFWVWVYVMGG